MLDSPEIKKLLAKYPDLRKSRNDATQKNRSKLEQLYSKCVDFIEYNSPAKQIIIMQNLKLLLENHRLEMNL